MSSLVKKTITATIVSDVSTSRPVALSIDWEPFFLNRDTGPDGEDLVEHLKKKYGDAAIARFGKPGNPLDVAGSKVGITFNQNRRVINTSKPHQIMEHLKASSVPAEKQDIFMDLLFQKYFEEGVDLSKTPALLGLVESVDGLNRSEIEAMLESNEHSESVMAKDEKYKRGGVSGVPFFFIGGYKFSGAQPPEVFEEIINEMLDES
ncbi:hypothetical protein TrST_g10786 [Triparma strigata]|uniref:DSBA-like thioredoxin domain-containing protein n=1 Tax=Triparma strigata TaxID=1606541 RepID=A0A9W7F1H8_9STRA|nr:hypothetical protein TrST_g10786 [Triparma strigata]